MPALDLFAFLISALLTIALIFYRVPTAVLQQGIALLLVILLIFARKIVFSDLKVSGIIFRFIFLILSSLFVQLLVLSSGGFYSPFLILLHLYTLGASFLLKLSSAISFLFFSLVILFAGTFLNQTLMNLFKEDPGSAIIYLISFIVIIPLAQFLMSTYHLKDTISKLLSEHIEIGEKREQSILSGLNELVIVTDINLKILSFNGAVEKTLKLPGIILGSSLLEAIRLKDSAGKEATAESLSVNKVLKNKITHFVEGFLLETRLNPDFRVSIQIRPVTNPAGEINQIAFVITDIKPSGSEIHTEFERAEAQQKTAFGQLREMINSAKLKSGNLSLLLLEKNEDDLFIAAELIDHPFRKMIGYQDLVEICQLIRIQKLPLAAALGINLKFEPVNDTKEQAYLSLKQNYQTSESLPPSEYSVPSDSKWLKVLIGRILDIATLLVSGQTSAAVNLSLSKDEDQEIIVAISANPVNIGESEKEDLLKEYFGSLMSKTNLRLGSGLEGFIAKIISSNLNLPLKLEVNGNILSISFQVSKGIQAL
ncbi:hypothetical protein A2111_00930 [Candidatus Daviesbacteria bacterium GWA1_38_6]|nr:MAG: hypothetical protein A2111_00930 [Candidatus Daviesbacteria bacterium GWA1_38_6]